MGAGMDLYNNIHIIENLPGTRFFLETLLSPVFTA